MKILIVEDSKLLAASIKQQLSGRYTVDVVHSGEEGLSWARNTDYGMMVLDLGLPDKGGYDVCRELRALGVDTPILILSGDQDVHSRARLLDCGADDFVTKPFNSEELRARVVALLRRSRRPLPTKEIRIDGLTIDFTNRRVSRSGMPIMLRRKEFDILQYLVLNQGRAMSRDMIFNHVWEDGKDGWNNTIDVHIKHLRDKVDRPFGTQTIKTAYGIGYMVEDPKRLV